jgi:hypothetical protein
MPTDTTLRGKYKAFCLRKASDSVITGKSQANKCPLKPNSKQGRRGHATHNFPISVLHLPLHPRSFTPSAYSISRLFLNVAVKLPTAPPSLQRATEKWSGCMGAKRESCVVRNVKGGADRPLSSCAGRTGGANLSPRDQSRPAGGQLLHTVQRLCC